MMWCGANANHRALASKMAAGPGLSALIIEKRPPSKKKRSVAQLVSRAVQKVRFRQLESAWADMIAHYDRAYPAWPNVPTLTVPNINNADAQRFASDHAPELVLVSGTRLVKEKMLALAPAKGIMNLHTGLSPYVKGGPNCTNWCLATGDFHLIGNTVMWIDLGIDTGALVATECTSLEGIRSLPELHLRVMEHAHDLYVRAATGALAGTDLLSVDQAAIAEGTTFYTRQWTSAARAKAQRNWPNLAKAQASGQVAIKRSKLITVPLPSP